jgi:hypothetical protein
MKINMNKLAIELKQIAEEIKIGKTDLLIPNYNPAPDRAAIKKFIDIQSELETLFKQIRRSDLYDIMYSEESQKTIDKAIELLTPMYFINLASFINENGFDRKGLSEKYQR